MERFGEFRKSAQAVELAGRTVLLIGFGRIGRRVAGLCRAFGLHVLVHDISASALRQAATAGYASVADLDSGLAQADVLTLHIPLTPHSAMLLDAARLRRLPRGAIVVNCARGGIVDETALAAMLADGTVGAAALDVFEWEPWWMGIPWLASTRSCSPRTVPRRRARARGRWRWRWRWRWR